jgi:hypothetical protein
MEPFRKTLAVLILISISTLSAGQKLSEDEYRKFMADVARQYQEKNWPAALETLDRLLVLTESDERHAGVLYNKACILTLANKKADAIATIRAAIAAGRTDYQHYLEDTDFERLREDPEFKSIMANLKKRYGPRMLEWDRTGSMPDFQHRFSDPAMPELVQMRREFSLDEVVSGAKDNYERLCRLTEWTSKQWEHHNTKSASSYNPLTILREARAGGQFICLNYAIVLAATASAYGMPSRVLGLMPCDVEKNTNSHSVAEVWIEQFKKWVLADGQYGAIAELNGVPLNGVELQQALAEEQSVQCRVCISRCNGWKQFIASNMYYFKVSDDQRLWWTGGSSKQWVLVPKGAPYPRKLAGGHEGVFAHAIYISDPEVFYIAPK